MKYSKFKKILLSGLVCSLFCLMVLVVWFFYDAVLTLMDHTSKHEPFPEWNQKDINYLEQLTGVKLPSGTVLLAYSGYREGTRHDVHWLIFSKDKIIFPCPLTDEIISAGMEKDALIKQCRIRKSQFSFSEKDEIQSNLSSFRNYDGKGHDVFAEVKTSKGYYVKIDICRISPRDSSVGEGEQKVPNEKMNNLH